MRLIFGMILMAGCAWGQMTVSTNRLGALTKNSIVVTNVTITGVVYTNDVAYTGTVAKAASALQPAITNGWTVSAHDAWITAPTGTNIAQAVISPYTNSIATAWQNHSYVTNAFTWQDSEDMPYCTITGYDSSVYGGDVIIPPMIGGRVVVGISDTVFQGRTDIQSIYCKGVIGDYEGYFRIPSQAFKGCTALGKFWGDKVIIGSESFSGASSLYSFDVVKLVGSTLRYGVFSNCVSLGSISLGEVVAMGDAWFSGCSSLSSVRYSGDKPSLFGIPSDKNPFIGLPANQVTNYVTNPTATGWGATFGGMPVVRLDMYGNVIGNATTATTVTGAQSNTIATALQAESDTLANVTDRGATTTNTITTPAIQAQSSAGASLKAVGGDACLTWGAGGGCNITTGDGMNVGGTLTANLFNGNGASLTNLPTSAITGLDTFIGSAVTNGKSGLYTTTNGTGVSFVKIDNAGGGFWSSDLQVNGTIQVSDGIRVGPDGAQLLPTSFYFVSGGGLTYYSGVDEYGPEGVKYSLYQSGTGHIGIGTNSPSEKLHVRGNALITSNLTVSGISNIILPASTNGLASGMLWNNGGAIEVSETPRPAYLPFTSVITPANGTATVVYAHGNMPSLTLDSATVITLDPTSYGTSGVSRVALSLYCGTNSVTLATNVITYATTPTLSTNCWNTILIRRVSNCVWKGVQL